jgi:hypothetical protein
MLPRKSNAVYCILCRYTLSDEQLYKDVDSLLDGVQDILSRLQPLRPDAFVPPETPGAPSGCHQPANPSEHDVAGPDPSGVLRAPPTPNLGVAIMEGLPPNGNGLADIDAGEQYLGGGSEQKTLSGGVELMVPLLELWDGVCGLFTGRPKPSHWVATLLRVCKLFPPEVRTSSGNLAKVPPTASPSLFDRLTLQAWLWYSLLFDEARHF